MSMESERCSNSSNTGNMVLFPFMAQGHMNPFLDLTRLITSRTSLTVTLVSTPRNILHLRPLFSSSSAVRFADLPFNPSDHGLPDHADNTYSLPQSLISRLYHAAESLQPSFHRLISDLIRSDQSPLCIVSDMFLGWTVPVARSLGVFHAVLYTSGPYAMSIYNSIWAHLPHLLTSDDVVTLPDLPGLTLHRSQLSQNMLSATSPDHASASFVRRQADLCRQSDATLWNTVDVLEKPFLDAWARSTGQPAWAVGPLFVATTPSERRGARDGGADPAWCKTWLDQHPAESVVYVSFGSQNSLPAEQTAELSAGLEESGHRFLWVTRSPVPEGFEERVRGRGLVVREWAPQLEVLGHVATGAFVSHCGWNSAMESLRYGVPVIGWPVGAEQFYNAKLMEEELGVCVELARGPAAAVGRREVAAAVGMVLGEERGREMRRRAMELGKEMERAVTEKDGVVGSSLRALDAFVETVLKHAASRSG